MRNNSIAYFCLVDSYKKKKKIRTIEAVPVYLTSRIEADPHVLESYCNETLGLSEPVIIIRKIKKQSLVKINGMFYIIAAKSGDSIVLHNATNMFWDQEMMNYIKKVDKFISSGERDKGITEEHNLTVYDQLIQKNKYGLFSKRLNSLGEKLEAGRDLFIKLSVEEQLHVLAAAIASNSMNSNGIVDLRLIGASKNTGILKISKNITSQKEIKLIHQSITGIYSHSIDLTTL